MTPREVAMLVRSVAPQPDAPSRTDLGRMMTTFPDKI